MTHSSYWKKIVGVFSGTAIAQAILLLGSLIIARIYAPDSFGVFATWLGISQIVTVGITYRLESAFGLEADGKTRTELVAVTVAMVLLTGGVLSMLLAVLAWGIGTLSNQIPAILLWLLIPQSVGMALSLVWESWAANNGDIKKLSIIRICQACFIMLMQIAAGVFYPDAASLAAAQTLAVWFSVLLCVTMMPLRSAMSAVNSSVMLRLMGHYWKKYRRFPLLALPADLINTAAAQMPVILIGSRFGAEIAGYYALATRMMGAPVALLGGAVRDVFKRAANEEFRALGHCRSIYQRTFWVLLGLSLAMVAFVIPFAEKVFSLVFGQQWALAGIMATWLIPRYALGFMASPLSYTFYVVQKQNIDLVWQVGLFTMTMLTLLIFDSYRNALLYYSGGYALMYMLYLGLSWRYCQQPVQRK
ncbi:hypothetical protein AXE65_12525 [Ventosimonas gracilis]|uniref:Polysaccharide biosynthesis protein n=1 Tax=Ventosimonas gracilis TaxID=1680762 RepID=A0A139SVY4_9GAMM|nr:oligosaccharide flippase family protein [Ventosimonas gracilis]KXU38664.1 hypothetical protein AXE65_12525 [Ventosimonas gracilis]